MKLRNIEITFTIKPAVHANQLFSDWYDLADYIKQENLAGRDVVIHSWKYSDRRL